MLVTCSVACVTLPVPSALVMTWNQTGTLMAAGLKAMRAARFKAPCA